MATREQLEAALVKADAAGNVEDARALATEIRRMQSANDSDFGRMVSGKKKPQNEWLRAAELTGRDAVEGLAGAVGMVTDPLVAGWNAATGRQDLDARSSAGALLDKIGAPRPETHAENIISGINQAGTGSAPFFGLGGVLKSLPGTIGRVGTAMADRPGLQALSAAFGGGASAAAREAGAPAPVQALVGLGAGVAPGAASYGLEGGLRYLLRGGEQGRRNLVENIDTFSRAGASPSVGQASESRLGRGVESLLSSAPGGAGPMARAAETQASQIGQRVEGITANLSPRANAADAGRGIEKGVDSFLDDFRTTSGALYSKAEQMVPPSLPVAPSNTQTYLAGAAKTAPGAKNISALLSNPKLASINDAMQQDLAANGGHLTFETMKVLRTKVGEMIGDAGIMADIPTKQLRKLYGALSSDMETAINATNNPQAIQAFRRANAHYKAGMNRMEVLERVVERNGGPEKVFSAAMSGTREGATTLRAVTQSLPPDGRKQLAAAVVRRMGKALPGKQDDVGEVFSTETFLTNWNSMAPEAKSALFARMGPRFNADMEAIAKAAANVRAGSKVFANPSGSAGKGAQISAATSFAVLLGTGHFYGAGLVAGGAATANVLAKAFTSPVTVRWLAQQTKLPAAAFAQQVAVLKRSSDPAAQDLAKELEADPQN